MTKPVSIANGAELDLAGADLEMRAEPAYALDGHTARTLVRDSTFLLTLARREEH